MDLRGQFLHPKDLSPYVAYTPYFRWPNCVDGPYCVFRVPIHVSASTCALALATPFDRCKGAPSQIMGPRCLVKHPLCQVCSYEINGTTYSTPQIPIIPLLTSPLMFYDHATIAVFTILLSICAAIPVERSRLPSLYTINGHILMGARKSTIHLILSFSRSTSRKSICQFLCRTTDS